MCWLVVVSGERLLWWVLGSGSGGWLWWYIWMMVFVVSARVLAMDGVVMIDRWW